MGVCGETATYNTPSPVAASIHSKPSSQYELPLCHHGIFWFILTHPIGNAAKRGRSLNLLREHRHFHAAVDQEKDVR